MRSTLMPRKPRLLDEPRGLLEALHAVHRLLHRRREILHAKGDPVEAEIGERVEMRVRGDPRIRLERELGAGHRTELLEQRREQVGELRRRVVRRRPAAEM
jgi:hypothetical protein